jgi:tetratricopeptide (TPR) repeat protein
MDRTTYLDPKVGEYLNAHFICVKVQMDRTSKDSDEIKGWYSDAADIGTSYKVSAYPTFLFLSPEGKALHKAVGYRSPADFLSVAQDALNPARQFFTLLEAYDRGTADAASMLALTEALWELDSSAHGREVLRSCLDHYLNKMTEADLLKEETLRTCLDHGRAVVKSSDRIFIVAYKNPDKVDAIMGQKGWAHYRTDFVVVAEEITPRIWKDSPEGPKPATESPAWAEMEETIAKKYDTETAGRIILDEKIKWYTNKHDHTEMARYNLEKLDRFGGNLKDGDGFRINNRLVDICDYVDDKSLLERAIGWQQKIVDANPEEAGVKDTLASLLYKDGRVAEAIEWEQKAVDEDAAAMAKRNHAPHPVFADDLKKMKNGLPLSDPN